MLTAGTLFSVAIAFGFFLGEKGGLNSCGVYILFFFGDWKKEECSGGGSKSKTAASCWDYHLSISANLAEEQLQIRRNLSRKQS